MAWSSMMTNTRVGDVDVPSQIALFLISMLVVPTLVWSQGNLDMLKKRNERRGLKLVEYNFMFEACVNAKAGDPKRKMIRAYTLSPSGRKRRVTVSNFKVISTDAAFWTVKAPKRLVLDRRRQNTGMFTLTFTPTEARDYNANLSFRLSTSSSSAEIKIPLDGKGKNCPGIGTGTGVAGTPGTPGGTTGTPPKPARKPLKTTEICLYFWTLPTARDVTRAMIDGWVKTANQVFGDTGVSFIHKKGSPGKARKNKAQNDAHCFDVFVGDGTLFPGDKAGETCPERPRNLENQLIKNLSVNATFAARSVIGLSLAIEKGAQAGMTLAHELGHTVGLGPIPARPAANLVPHLDPKTGAAITDQNRLMHPQATGTDLIELEKQVAEFVAPQVKGAKGKRGCERSQIMISDTIGIDEQTIDIERVIARHDREQIEFLVGLATPGETEMPALRLSIEVDTDLDQDADRTVQYEHRDGQWLITTPAPMDLDYAPLDQPALVYPDPFRIPERGMRGVSGFIARVPKGFLNVESGPMGWRVKLEHLDTKAIDWAPDQLFSPLDLTPPMLFIDLDEARRDLTAAAGETLRLAGTAQTTSTFAGMADIRLWISNEDEFRELRLGVMTSPMPERWAFSAPLPDDLPPGVYQATVIADCEDCATGTSTMATLEVIGPDDDNVGLPRPIRRFIPLPQR